jgi:hypothetical protein
LDPFTHIITSLVIEGIEGISVIEAAQNIMDPSAALNYALNISFNNFSLT